MKSLLPSSWLRFALLADAGMSTAAAALQLGATAWLVAALQLPQPLLLESGLFMVGYAALLVVLARSPRVWTGLVALVVWGNVGWAVACVLLALTGAVQPTALGLAFLGLHAAGVLVMAAWQYAGLRRSLPAPRLPGVSAA